MRDLFDADGDSWRVTSDGSDTRRNVRTIVFHCVSNSQRPYRVIEVADPALQNRALDEMTEQDLGALFQHAHTMDYSHDASADAQRHGLGERPPQ